MYRSERISRPNERNVDEDREFEKRVAWDQKRIASICRCKRRKRKDVDECSAKAVDRYVSELQYQVEPGTLWIDRIGHVP